MIVIYGSVIKDKN